MKQQQHKRWMTEITAGLIGYLTTVYIVAVNSSILAEAGLDREQAMVATILASVFGCLIMGMWGKVPIILIPGMGVNVLFAFSIVKHYGLSYEQGLAIVVVSSFIFLLTAVTPLGEKFKLAVPDSLKHGITIGLGLFLVLIGLENGGLIVSGEYSMITLGDFSSPTVIVTLLTLILGIVLFIKNVPANFLITMILGTWLASIFGILNQSNLSNQISLEEIQNLIIVPDFSFAGELVFWMAVLPLTIVLIFESMGLISGQLGVIKRSEQFNNANQSSALSAVLSGFLGTSPTIPAAETAAMIASKARTGVATIVTGTLFLITIFFIPYISMIPSSAISPILIIVGVLMMQNIKHIQIDDLTEAFPTFLIMFMIPFTYSIADGMAFGFIAYPIIKLATKQQDKLSPLLIVISGLFLIEFIFKALI